MMKIPTPAELAGFIQFPMFRPSASAHDVERHCAAARAHKFSAVCVNGCRVELARHYLEDSEVKVAAVVGFPLGAMSCDTKRFEAEAAIDDGAQEIHAVLNLGRLKDGDSKFVLRELHDIVDAADERPVTVVLEMGLLSEEEARLACGLILDCGAKHVATSTGFADARATLAAVRLLRGLVGEKPGVTACGVVPDAAAALGAIEAGATRVCAANAVSIIDRLAGGAAASSAPG